MSKKTMAEILFWMHLVLFIIWFGLFFIPKSVWYNRVVFHFWYVAILVLGQLLIGLFLMKKMRKYRIVCLLTSAMQSLRGHKFGDARNFDHSFIREFAARVGIKIPYGFVGCLIFLSFGVLSVQYFLYLGI